MSNTHRHVHALPNGFRVHWYEIQSILGQGGFGITYRARDTNLDQTVAIKEYLPADLAVRSGAQTVQPVSGDAATTYDWGLKRFIKEAQTLARFKHPNIVAVNAVFEEFNTAYMVMEYVDGETFEDAVRKEHLGSEEQLLHILYSVCDGVDLIHRAGFIHRDIKPDNIYIRKDGSPVLLDFGSARQAMGTRTNTLTALVSPGYAPYEQYDSSHEVDKQGPWTDIYALGATFYRAIAGKGPADAMSRVHAILEGRDRYIPAVRLGAGRYSEQLLAAIDKALEFRPGERPQSIQEWRRILPSLPKTVRLTGLMPRESAKPRKPRPLVPPEEEETVVLSEPLISAVEAPEAGAAARPEEEETMVRPAPLVPDAVEAPKVGAVVRPEEEETVVLSEPLISAAVEAPEAGAVVRPEEEETVVLSEPLISAAVEAPEARAAARQEEEETMVRAAPIVPAAAEAPEARAAARPEEEETLVRSDPLRPAPRPLARSVATAAMMPTAGSDDGETPAAQAGPGKKEKKLPTGTSRRRRMTIIGEALAAVIVLIVAWIVLTPTGFQPSGEKLIIVSKKQERAEARRAAAEATPTPSGTEEGVDVGAPASIGDVATAKVAAEDLIVVEREAAEAEREKAAESARLAILEQAGIQKPAEAVEQKPAEAVEQKPVEVVEQKPVEVVEQKPVEVVEQKPVEAVEQKPAEVVEQKPVEAVEQRDLLAKIDQAKANQEETERLRREKEIAEAAAQLAEQQKVAVEIEDLLAQARVDIAHSKLTTPAGDNALLKLRSVLEMDPGNQAALAGLDDIVQEYIELADKASEAGRLDKAGGYLERAAVVLPDSAALAAAEDRLALAREAAQEAADEVAAAEEEPAKQAEIAKLPEAEESLEVATPGRCEPKLLSPRPSAFGGIVAVVYDHPAFRNTPAPKVKWASYRYTSRINDRASEESVSRYQIVDEDGVSARVQKNHELSFDNGNGTYAFKELSDGMHIQVLGGLITPIDELSAVREIKAVKDGVAETSSTIKKTKTTTTRLYEISGQLFPLKVGNFFSYKDDTRIESDSGEVQALKHEGKPYVYYVTDVVPGETIDSRLSCRVFVLDYSFEKPQYRNTGKLYFSEELGLIAKQVGTSVSTLSDGRAISRHYERTLQDFEIN